MNPKKKTTVYEKEKKKRKKKTLISLTKSLCSKTPTFKIKNSKKTKRKICIVPLKHEGDGVAAIVGLEGDDVVVAEKKKIRVRGGRVERRGRLREHLRDEREGGSMRRER
jgi:hypothetical protein